MTISWWPMLNAGLNATSATMVLLGYAAIRRQRVRRHRVCMLVACAASLTFFVSYLWYHVLVGSVRFTGPGWLRGPYLTILASHTVLAIVIVPLVIRTVWLAVQRRLEAHRRWARVTLPLWLYVSVTGIIVYLMLYHLT